MKRVMDMNKRRYGKFLLSAGLILICLGLILLAVFQHEDRMAGKNAQLLHEELDRAIRTGQAQEEGYTINKELVASVGDYELLGILRVPSLELELPILADWSYELLSIAPCRYTGTVHGRDLILMGHNFDSHFTPLKKLTSGDEVLFTDCFNRTYTYQVELQEVLHKTEREALVSADYDLSLFTCTYGGENRAVIRCNMKK